MPARSSQPVVLDPLFRQYGFGQTAPLPYAAIHHAFEHHVKQRPDAVAVEHLDECLSYAELDRAANRLAHRLRADGVVPGTRVCLLVQRSVAMVVGIIATLKAGAAYVPLDGGIVTESTLNHVLADSAAVLTLATTAFVPRVQSRKHICLEDAIAHDLTAESDGSKPPDLSSPRDGVYVIYTSGTTGKPKGVDVMHRNVVNLLCLSPGNVGMRPGLRVAQLLNIAFDMCAWEVLGSLANGCTLCLRGKTAAEWKAVLRTVDVVIATPSVLGMYDPKDYPNIKYAATAGEVCPQSLADAWSKNGQFFNSCGPTEITIVNTVQPHTLGAPLSIGVPTPNNNVYILDDSMRPVQIGEAGLMWAGGAGITRGYINLPDKTAERYRLDPFANDGSMMFNTGDIGRWRADGQLEHLGRADDQVKVKGFRVELDGVAAAMETCSSVRVATALLIGKELWGFYTPAGVSPSEVKVATAQVQPYYAVPARYMSLPEFPQTSNGKVDKRALRRLAEVQIEATAAASLASAVVEKNHIRRGSQAKSFGHSMHAPRKSITEHPQAGPSRQQPAKHKLEGAIQWRTNILVDLSDVLPPKKALALQSCTCPVSVSRADSSIHAVPTLVSCDSDTRNGVQVLAISANGPRIWKAPLNTSDLAWSSAIGVLLVVGGKLTASDHLRAATMCLSCRGWIRGTTSLAVSSISGTKVATDLVIDTTCELLDLPGVDLVTVVSDAYTSHTFVNELGHRGVSVHFQSAVHHSII
ncbi:acetyl-CoA synthetase-like protein [Auriculariales sp. MPI-PUGE-AT-0066]|nr:acetyl-CoA synthetase-like protein [Auriculariales sp. MPI-PUGE-AT-0066]